MTRPGRVLLCFSDTGGVSITFGDAVRAALKIKASALIFAEPVPRPEGPDLIPTIRIDFIQGDQLRKYQQTFTDGIPKVKIGPTKAVIRKSVAPRVAYFSSRGPSSIEPDILKPDISAPGLNILAAWPTKTPPIPGNGIIDDNRTVEWNFQSGTSMSCPHVSGIVALLKSAHPNWSPAALRSALMTTAYTRDNSLDEILSDGSPTKVSDPFDIGAGHVDPVRAMDPGLVYDMKTSDHILFLCNLGYTQEQIQVLLLPCPSPDLIRCPKSRKPNFNLNYPSITVSNLRSTVTIKRTVRNVGPCKCALYFSSVVEPNGVQVVVWPKVLFFSWFREEVTYHVTLIPRKKSQGRYDFGEIVWSDYSSHKVTSPLVVRVNTFDTTSTTSAAHEEDDDDDDDQLISEA
ncbi:subtilisin-like protease SBT3.18 [Morus notabilis]|nr:subtilisin-like protease SBT3.18 [Morus notabilis]